MVETSYALDQTNHVALCEHTIPTDCYKSEFAQSVRASTGMRALLAYTLVVAMQWRLYGGIVNFLLTTITVAVEASGFLIQKRIEWLTESPSASQQILV